MVQKWRKGQIVQIPTGELGTVTWTSMSIIAVAYEKGIEYFKPNELKKRPKLTELEKYNRKK